MGRRMMHDRVNDRTYDRTALVPMPDGRGRTRAKVGTRTVDLEIMVDVDKLIHQKGEKAALNKKGATVLCFGAVTIKAVNVRDRDT